MNIITLATLSSLSMHLSLSIIKTYYGPSLAAAAECLKQFNKSHHLLSATASVLRVRRWTTQLTAFTFTTKLYWKMAQTLGVYANLLRVCYRFRARSTNLYSNFESCADLRLPCCRGDHDMPLAPLNAQVQSRFRWWRQRQSLILT